jgi:hypothetical protein
VDERSGWPAEGGRRVLLLYELSGRRVTPVSQKDCLAWVCSQYCVLVAGLAGVLGSRPTGGLYVCKYVSERKVIIIIFEMGCV